MRSPASTLSELCLLVPSHSSSPWRCWSRPVSPSTSRTTWEICTMSSLMSGRYLLLCNKHGGRIHTGQQALCFASLGLTGHSRITILLVFLWRSFPFPLPGNFLSELPLHRKCHSPGKLLASFFHHVKTHSIESYLEMKPFGKMSPIYPNKPESTHESLGWLSCLLSSLLWWKFDSRKFEHCELCLFFFFYFLRPFYAFSQSSFQSIVYCVLFTSAQTHIYKLTAVSCSLYLPGLVFTSMSYQ